MDEIDVSSLMAELHPLFSPEGAVQALLWRRPDGMHEGMDRPDGPVRAWLADYARGRFRTVDFPLDPQGTPFQKRVWQRLLAIPPGRTMTYGELAHALGSGPRAIGRSVGCNPIPVLIPCHRVVAADGPGGFTAPGGVVTKLRLLRLEGWPGVRAPKTQ